ncbi:lanthionine synthetase C family protein [Streptomyces sp. SID7958]|uniref:Lanthionine synthetase C family protein n=2 Tax=unclassified Streptomyces TaxID=2593676 RepID=A0A6G3QUM6_9ACTN|nr:lanthionine synthetase C family protein [Streptomyces sp. SID14436]NEC82058.1 lanthionine synthetase C family protein [Streptomyces sp. SID7958]
MTTAPPKADTSLASRQSLAHGPLGAALLDVERAHLGLDTWQVAHRKLAIAAPLIDGDDASLFLGAPAMAYVLHMAAGSSDRYAGALRTLDDVMVGCTRRRLVAAHERIEQGRLATFAEYDLFRGLTGLGALLLRRQPHGPEMRRVLEYLVRLTEPVTGPDGQPLPGWWVGHAPASNAAATPGGHANAGLAHGITGPLALLALAQRRGVTVEGHEAAMGRILRWLDAIRQSDHNGTHWPRWVSKTGPAPTHVAAPSWCYGTPGVVRAQQLAAIALGDDDRKRMAERALLYCLADDRQLDLLHGRGLCHGVGGLIRTVQRVAEEAETPAPFQDWLTAAGSRRFLAAEAPEQPGFLEGAAGASLAFRTVEPGARTATDWDACLLLS